MDKLKLESTKESLPYDWIDATNASLHKVERDLEEIGRSICNKKGSARSWNRINMALSAVREAICETHWMLIED